MTSYFNRLQVGSFDASVAICKVHFCVKLFLKIGLYWLI